MFLGVNWREDTLVDVLLSCPLRKELFTSSLQASPVGVLDDLGDGKYLQVFSLCPFGNILGYFHILSNELGKSRRGKGFHA